ncbi:OmpA family protein [Pedobacter sp. PAMC26386]|nr:OmpA family protein [Pedobacter sp. PAMC26386]
MAFDLNKNDGSSKDLSNKVSASSKFDLSKGETKSTTVSENSSKSKTWIIGLIGILIIGGGIWYSLLTKGVPSDTIETVMPEAQAMVRSDNVVPDTAIKNPSPVATPSTDQTIEKPIVENTAIPSVETASGDKNAAVLNHKIPATFRQGSSSFVRVDQLLIKRIVAYLTKNPNTVINVNGYASSDGPLEVNQAISQARADAFKKYLVSRNIAESRIVASGKGIENPIASNDSNAGRKKNRRVEITLP